MARRALCLSVCAVMDELGSSRIAASWVGVFDLTPVLFPRNTPCSCGKHLSGQAACPERTGEEVLSEGEFLEGKTGPFLLPLCSKEEEVGIAVPSLPHRGLWGAQCCVEVRARKKPPVCSQASNHPATLDIVSNHPKKERGGYLLACCFLGGRFGRGR